jgi:hypothetical protein
MKHTLKSNNLLLHVSADGVQELHAACAHGDGDEVLIRLIDGHFETASLLGSSHWRYASPAATNKEVVVSGWVIRQL